MARPLFPLVLAVLLAAMAPAWAQDQDIVIKKVAVLPFPVLAREPQELWGRKVREEFQERLKAEGMTVIPPEEVDRVVPRPADLLPDSALREAGQKLGADVVVSGRLLLVGDLLTLEARLVDVTGRVPPSPSRRKGPASGP